MTREFLLIGDVGGDVFHVGDEAMFETALAEIAARCDASITAVSCDPASVTRRYGVKAVPHLGFDRRVGSAYDVNRERRLEEILDGTASDPTVVSMRTAMNSVDAVLVCGGGNLAAAWPHLLYERLAVLALATRRGIPTVLIGQTVGPALTARSAARLTDALAGAALVGVRDLPSARLVRQLAPAARVLLHEDDAAQLPGNDAVPGLPSEYVVVTVHGNADEHVVERYLDFVTHLHAVSGLPVVLVPHTGALDGSDAPDTDAALMATMCKRHPDAEWLQALPVQESATSAAVLRNAAVVVSARFHPLVFALSAGVPCVGLTSDHYTDIKLEGALAHHGLADWRLPLHTLGTGPTEALVEEMWRRRVEIRAHLSASLGALRIAHERRWDLVVRCLQGDTVADTDPADAPDVVELSPTTVHTRAALTWDEQLQHIVRQLELSADRAEEYALSLRDALDQEMAARAADRRAAERDRALLQAALDAARDESEEAHRAAEAARELAGRLHVVLDRGPLAAPPANDLAAVQRELDAMRNTKLFRWTSPLRRVYGRLRTSGSRRRS
jgi:polysaccharide pyruvyl transferase WcaK-like protein